MFVEQWAAVNGYRGVFSKEMTPWRRLYMSNLVNAFDFTKPDLSVPHIARVATPEKLAEDPRDHLFRKPDPRLVDRVVGRACQVSIGLSVAATAHSLWPQECKPRPQSLGRTRLQASAWPAHRGPVSDF